GLQQKPFSLQYNGPKMGPFSTHLQIIFLKPFDLPEVKETCLKTKDPIWIYGFCLKDSKN
ncbi:hypothetical protein, partial [Klebsiella pneumoniae]|uniref:hypothetical protein n=1 Tax=Klebsiella pneumoniae TaxID=573 RepID=UPI0030141AAA